MYDKGKYDKQSDYTNKLHQFIKVKANAERMFYLYSKSLYNTNQFYLTGYQFENFVLLILKVKKLKKRLHFLAA